jgi:hypothetical protein
MSIIAYEHVSRIRREKYGLNEDGALNGVNPLANDLKHSIDNLAQGLYTRNAHFIFELIQNAEDNEYSSKKEPSLTFKLFKNDPTNTPGSDGALIVENNEEGFLEKNIDAICAVGKSTKKNHQGYIGEKGIGFKSVFRVTSNPFLFSNGYRVSLPEKHEKTELGYIVPEWVENIPTCINLSSTSIVLPLDKDGFGYETIKEMLNEVEPETVLFLSNLKEIEIDMGDSGGFSIIKDDRAEPVVKLLSDKKGNDDIFKYLLFKKTFDRPEGINHEKRNGVNQREVFIAFPIGDNSNSAGKLFAYLPVRFDTGFPFIINADFILPSSREDIQDIPWNRDWLMPCVGKLISTSLPILKERKQISVPFLQSLAKSVRALNEKSIYFPIAKAVKEAFATLEIFPSEDGSFVSVRNAKLARGKELIDLFSPEQLGTLFGRSRLYWLDSSISARPNDDLYIYLVGRKKNRWSREWDLKPLMEEIEVSPKDIAKKLTDSFFEQQSTEWLVKFIEYAEKGPQELKKLPLIRLTNGKHVALPHDKSTQRPAWFAPQDPIKIDLSNFPLVHAELTANEKVRTLLEKEGIREIDSVAIVEKVILPKYQDQTINFDESSYREHLRQIRKAYEKSNDSAKQELKHNLDNYAWLACVHASGNEPEKIVWKRVGTSYLFYKTNDHDVWFKDLNDVDAYFPHPAVPEELTGNVSNLVNYTDSLAIKIRPQSETVRLKSYRGDNKQGLYGFNPDATVIGIESALEAHWNMERAKILWRILLDAPRIIGGYTQSSRNKNNLDAADKKFEFTEVGKLCLKHKWLQDKNKIWCKPSELFLSDLPEEFDSTSSDAKDVADKLCMRKPEEERALELVTDGDQFLKKFIDSYKNSPDKHRRKLMKFISQEEYPPALSPSFSEGLERLCRPQRGSFSTRSKYDDSQRDYPVKNPERYQDKCDEEVANALDDHSKNPQRINFSPVRDKPNNKEAREFLYSQYRGRCQITGMTFPKASISTDGISDYYFEVCSLLSYSNANYFNNPGNMLCVSANTMAKLKYASFEWLDDIRDKIAEFEEQDMKIKYIVVKIKLAGEECTITWSQRHFIRLVSLYKQT